MNRTELWWLGVWTNIWPKKQWHFFLPFAMAVLSFVGLNLIFDGAKEKARANMEPPAYCSEASIETELTEWPYFLEIDGIFATHTHTVAFSDQGYLLVMQSGKAQRQLYAPADTIGAYDGQIAIVTKDRVCLYDVKGILKEELPYEDSMKLEFDTKSAGVYGIEHRRLRDRITYEATEEKQTVYQTETDWMDAVILCMMLALFASVLFYFGKNFAPYAERIKTLWGDDKP